MPGVLPVLPLFLDLYFDLHAAHTTFMITLELPNFSVIFWNFRALVLFQDYLLFLKFFLGAVLTCQV